MKIRLLSLLLLSLVCMPVDGKPDKVQSDFWGNGFGASPEQVIQTLQREHIDAQQGHDLILFRDGTLTGFTYTTVYMLFSSVDGGLYKVIGSNAYQDKQSAELAFDTAFAKMRETYPKAQTLRNQNGAQKMLTYTDGDNVVYVALFKSRGEDGKVTYFVNTNFWNKLAQDHINETRQQ